MAADVLVIQCKEPQLPWYCPQFYNHYGDIIIRTMASQITASRLFAQPFVQVQIKKTSKLHITGLCEGNSPVTGGFPSQRASNTENASIWWPFYDYSFSTRRVNWFVAGNKYRFENKNSQFHFLYHNPLHINANSIRCIPEDLIGNKSSLIQVMVLCRI